MKARPILFSAPMVRALLDDRKTQTRRIVKPQPIGHPWFWAGDEIDPEPGWFDGYEEGRSPCGAADREVNKPIRCPYGAPGDLLYVRETWRTLDNWDCLKPRHLAEDPSKITYDADPENRAPHWAFGKTRVAIHMPRWASRLTLEITDVRVERLQAISRGDAQAEGLFHWTHPDCDGDPRLDGQLIEAHAWNWREPEEELDGFGNPINAYRNLWSHINGPDSWAANPWCWAVSFSVIRKNVDEVLRDRAN